MRRLTNEHAVMAEQVTGRGVHGVVAAAAPQAAQAGAAMLRSGGNAFDAAVSAALAETVLLPPKCGLGGDLIAIVQRAGDPAPQALVAVGGAAAGLAAVARSGTWRDVGPDSVGPPGAAAGYAALADLGVRSRSDHAEPAIRLATDGFAWAKVCTRLSEQGAALVAEMHPEGCVYYPDGQAIAPGAAVRLPGLGAALTQWVERGADLLAGPVGEAIERAVVQRGGVLRATDFAAATATWSPCAATEAAGRLVWATPAPTHGPSLLDAIADFAATPMTADDLHAAVMRAIGRQRVTLGDPGGTSMVSAADAAGNVVVIVHSNSYPRFGSGIVVPEYDLPLANRAGRGFTPERGHPNFPVAGRRPATTLHAWAAADEHGAPTFFGGTPGGANQMPWNAQSLARIIGGERRPGVLVTAPLWEWLPDDDGIRVEAGFDAESPAPSPPPAARSVSASRWGCKSAQQVTRVPADRGVWEAAADPRTVGLALGV